MRLFYRILKITVILLLLSCDKDFLEIKPTDALTSEDYFRNADDAQELITATYASLRNLNSNDYAKLTEAGLNDIKIFNTSGLDFDSWNFDSSSSIIDEVWQGAYEGVFRSNIVIQEVPDIEMEKQEKDRIVAEARFLRSLFYWQLTSVFGEVPLITKADITNPSASQLPKNTLDELYDFMIDELIKASSSLANKSDYSDDDFGRVTKGAVHSLLGKIYLYKEDYSNAAVYLDSVITSHQYSLISDFSKLLVEDNNSESIFEIQYKDEPNQGTDRLWNDYPQGQGGFSNLLPTQDLVDAFEENKGSSGINGRDSRLFFSIFRDGDPYDEVSPTFSASWTPTGYAKKKGSFPVVRTDNANLGRNFPIIRFADVLLMYAEAANEIGEIDEAINAINRVRNRVEMPDLPTSDYPVSNKNEIWLAIVHERRVELAFEHHYLFDLRRWDLAEEVLSPIGYNEERNRYFPIPEQEKNNNPEL